MDAVEFCLSKHYVFPLVYVLVIPLVQLIQALHRGPGNGIR